MGYDHYRFARRVASSLEILNPGVGSYPRIRLYDAGTVNINSGVGDPFSFKAGTVNVATLSESTNVTTLEGGSTTGDDLILKANTVDARPYLTLLGGSGSVLSLETGGNLDIAHGGTSIAKVEAGGGSAGGVLKLRETTTPTATADFGALYTKADNHLYWQSGAGVEYDLGGA